MYCIFWQPQHKRLAEWSECSWQTEMANAGARPCRGAEGAGLVQPGEGKALGGDNSSPQAVPMRRLSHTGSQAPHCCACWADETLRAEAEGGEVQTSGIFPLRTVRCLSRWPKSCVTPSWPWGSKTQLGLLKAFSNLVWPSCFEQEVGIQTPQIPFQHDFFYDPMIYYIFPKLYI